MTDLDKYRTNAAKASSEALAKRDDNKMEVIDGWAWQYYLDVMDLLTIVLDYEAKINTIIQLAQS